MIRSREELLNSVRSAFADDTSDETLALIEDITDTVTDLETKANGDGVNWKQRYEENDATWRKKYRDRFFSGTDDDPDPNPKPESSKPRKFEDLFKED